MNIDFLEQIRGKMMISSFISETGLKTNTASEKSGQDLFE